MGDYSMPNYFQNMEQVGKELAHIDEENEKLIKDVEEEIGKLIDEIHEAGTPTEAINEKGQMTALQRIADLIDEVLADPENEQVISRVRQKVNDTMKNYPLFAY